MESGNREGGLRKSARREAHELLGHAAPVGRGALLAFRSDEMDTSLSSLINVYTLSTGRRLLALGQVQKAAKECGFKELVAHCQQAQEHDRKTRATESIWAQASTAPVGNAALQRIDYQLDRTLVAIRDGAQAHAEGAADGDVETPARVAKLLSAIFPYGVTAVTRATFVDELSAVERILEQVKDPELASIVEELGLVRLVKQLARQAVEYRRALEVPDGRKKSFGDVRAARAKGQHHVLVAVVMILARYPGDSPEEAAARGALLGPIVAQNEAVRLYLKARRAVQDVNPETGEIEQDAPAEEPSGAPANGDGAGPAAPV